MLHEEAAGRGEEERAGYRVAPAAGCLTALKEGFSNLDTASSGQAVVLRLNDNEKSFIRDNAANQALETIRNRIDQFGVSEPTILPAGHERDRRAVAGR
jgi:preprotein translocase subunit SecD